jgi:hypothetical protein
MSTRTTLHLRKVIFSILYFLSNHFITNGQHFTENEFAFYTTKDGLSDNRITSIAQDQYGYLWVATQKGLNRYDGNSFLQFFSDSSVNSLPEDYIKQLKWLGKSLLGASTATGLHIINTSSLDHYNLTVPPGPLKHTYRESNVWGMAGDKAGNIFLLTATGFYHFNNNRELVFRYDHYKEESEMSGIPFGRSDGIIMPEPGLLLLSTTAGIYTYNVSSKSLHAINENDPSIYRHVAPAGKRFWFMHENANSFSVHMEASREIIYYNSGSLKKQVIYNGEEKLQLFNWRSKLTQISDTTFLISGAHQGFYIVKYDPTNDRYTLLPETHLENHLCTTIFLDKHDQVWIGTDKGLLRQKRNSGSLQKMTIPVSMNPENRNLTVRMVTIADQKLFIATLGQGVMVLNRENLTPIKHIFFPKKSDGINTVHNIITTSTDSVYVGTYGPLIGISGRTMNHRIINLPDFDKSHHWISAQLLDASGNHYVGFNKSGKYYLRKSGESNFTLFTELENSKSTILTPMYMSLDQNGYPWFAGHGVTRLNTTTHKFDIFIDSFPKIKTTRKEVLGLSFDQKGNLYFGLPDNGLIIYDPLNKSFQHFTRTDGLPDNSIRATYVHGNKVWLGTDRGLASYEITTGKISSYGVADDMPEGPFTALSFYYDSLHQQLYGAFNNSIIRFNPDSLSKNNSPPAFLIESINISGRKTIHHPGEKITLSYKFNNLIINLSAVNFEDAFQQQFAYRFVKDGDEPWQEIGSQRSIIFSNLRPGTHHLQVKVFTKSNSWTEQVREIELTIQPPFWQKIWFILAIVFLLISLLVFLYRHRIRNISQKASIDRQLAELEIKGLHAQMNPHFIFNALNSIKEMILEDEKQNASRYLSKFAQLIRTNLEQSRQTFISVAQCEEHLKQYLEMEKIRFDNFEFTLSVSDDLTTENIQMPPMLVQPLVENAIWHGLHPLQGDKKLSIRFSSTGSKLICEIEDNGIGIVRSRQNKFGVQPSHHSLGINNVKERLTVLNEKYKMNCSLSIIDKESMPGNNGSGTLVRLELTILNHNS